MRKDTNKTGAAISHRTILPKANAEISKKSATRSRVESRRAPNGVTLLNFRATMPSMKSNKLPIKAGIAKRYHWLRIQTKKSRDGILPNRVMTFGFV